MRVLPLPEYKVKKSSLLRAWLKRPHPNLRILLLLFLLGVATALLLTGCNTVNGLFRDIDLASSTVADRTDAYTASHAEPQIIYVHREPARVREEREEAGR